MWQKEKKRQIHVVAPGMPFDFQALRRSLELVKSWGWYVVLPKDLQKKNHPICSASRALRLQHLKNALMSPTEDVIWAVRGGFGSLHLVPELLKMKKPKTQKLLMGFSDITTLHLMLNQHWGWETWHGPHLDRLSSLEASLQKEIRHCLDGNVKDFSFSKIRPLNLAAKKIKKIKAVLIGGNLVTLQSSLATKIAITGQGKILFFEDIGERGYRVDRILEHFIQAGVFKNVRAVVFGPFVGGEEPGGKSLVEKVLKEFSERQRFPVFTGVASGHIPRNHILPLGQESVIEKVGERYSLNITSRWCDEHA